MQESHNQLFAAELILILTAAVPVMGHAPRRSLAEAKIK